MPCYPERVFDQPEVAPDYAGDVEEFRLYPLYETRMTHRGAMALVGQKSLHLKQATHNWACTGSALWFTILNTPIEQRSTQIPQPLQKNRSTYTSIKIVGEGPTSKVTDLERFQSLMHYKFDGSAHDNEEDYPSKTALEPDYEVSRYFSFMG